MENNITYFAKTNFRNQEKTFGIKTDDRRRHTYLIGKTGMGKTKLMKNMIIQDIRNGHGVAFLDPHGDDAEDILNFIPANRINDVIYFNPSDQNFPIAFNILESIEGKDKKHLIVSGLMGVFKKLWPDVWSARMEYILNNTILALLENPGSTMLGINRMFSDKDYRKKIIDKVTDPVVKSFWINEFARYTDRLATEATSSVQNKVGQFLSSAIIRNIIGQTKSTVNMREIMDGQKILIVNLSKGKIGEDNMKLLGGMIVTKLQLAAMERVDIPEDLRKDFYLYVDELQNFVNESFAGILSEARKYRLSLILAHQYIKQLPDVIRDAIFGNAGTLITFRVGAEDAEFLEKEFEPAITMNDIINLPKYNIYLKLMIDGITSNAFSATSLPPMDPEDKSSFEKIIKVSRERYGKARADVEEKIIKWTGIILAPPTNIIESRQSKNGNIARNYDNANGNSNNFSDNANGGGAERNLYKVNCAECGKETFVPFEPDGRRPIFCEQCLKKLRTSGVKFSHRKEEGQSSEENANKAIANSNNNKNFRQEENISNDNPNDKQISLKDALSKALSGAASKQVNTKGRQKEVDVTGVRDLIKNVLEKRVEDEESDKNKISAENGEMKEGEEIKF